MSSLFKSGGYLVGGWTILRGIRDEDVRHVFAIINSRDIAFRVPSFG